MDNTQLAELLMGIAKAQAAIIDAVERAKPGFRNNHAVPMLTTAANVRAAVPRIQDLPARILLRMQGRAAFDVAQIQQDLEAAFASHGAAPGASAEPGANLSPAAIAGGGEGAGCGRCCCGGCAWGEFGFQREVDTDPIPLGNASNATLSRR